MDLFESYFFLFYDSLFSALILPPRSEMVVKLMAVFSGYNNYLVFTLAIIGSTSGSLVNWWIGKYFLFLHKTEFFKKRQKEIAKAQEKWRKYLVWILLFSWMDVIGNPFAAMAGFFKTDVKKFLLLVLLGKFFYYYLLIFCDIDLKTIYAN